MKYDKTNKDSIYKYAQQLEMHSFNSICDNDDTFLTIADEQEKYKMNFRNKRRKGGLGELVEERFFHYKADNEARADFPEAELELKVTPFKVNKNGSVSAKERISVAMINYFQIVDVDFFESNAWEKIKNILLIYYEDDPKTEDRLDLIIKYVYLYSPSGEDLQIIIEDFNKIKKKVIEGKAHELSEGDTLYLGAATKSTNAQDRKKQPFSPIEARPRAFSLKNSYMTYLLRNHIVPETEQRQIIKQESIAKGKIIPNFENHVLNTINEHSGKLAEQLFNTLLDGEYGNSYDDYSRIAKALLGVKTENVIEFEKANIEVKTIRLSLKSDESYFIKEHMSFPAFNIKELVNEVWEESSIRTMFEEKKYLFVFFEEGKDKKFRLKNAVFWNMPLKELDTVVKEEWERAKNILKKGPNFILKKQKNGIIVKNNLPKSSDTKALHVRPHTSLAAYALKELNYYKGNINSHGDELLNGDFMTKQSFWLNNHFILKNIFGEYAE